MIGIIGAMQEEIDFIKESISEIQIKEIASFTFYSGKINGKDIVLVMSGIGKVNAAVCTNILLESFKADKIIFTGVAGAMNPELEIGDIVVSTDLVQHDMDVTAFGCKPGEIPRMKNSIFVADDSLIKQAYKSGKKIFSEEEKNKVIKGRVLSGDQFISSEIKIKWLNDTFKGDCVEMEGAAVAHVCYLYNVPFVVLRAISDKADHSANIDFQSFVKIAAMNSKKIVLDMISEMR